MLAFLLLGLLACGVSLLTLFSGFGLGTLLLPAFALVLPIPVAVASTAVVHAANNLFKLALLAGQMRRDVLVRFGIPAVAASFLGALLLTALSETEPLLTWEVVGREATMTPLGLVMGGLILVFAVLELVPGMAALRAPVSLLPLGGALSGFFGGLSGHQGAMRAAFLAPLGMKPAEFAATQAALAVLVDAVRLVVYGASFAVFSGASSGVPWPLVAFVTASAFAGAIIGKRLLPKMTMARLHQVVGWLLVLVGLVVASGL